MLGQGVTGAAASSCSRALVACRAPLFALSHSAALELACVRACLLVLHLSLHQGPRDRHHPPLTSFVLPAFTKHRGSWCKPTAVRSRRRAPGSAWRASSTPPFGCGATSIVLALLQCLLFRTKTTSSKVPTRAAFMSSTCARCGEKGDTYANVRAAPVLRCCGSAPLSLDPTLALRLASPRLASPRTRDTRLLTRSRSM